MCALIEASDPSEYQMISELYVVPSWHVGRSIVIGQGKVASWSGHAAPPERQPRNPEGIPWQSREGAPAGPQSASPARKRARWEGNFLPAARRCAHSSRTAGRQRLPAPHAGACRCSRLCPSGALRSTLRASPWCPIRPRVSRGDCSFSQLQLRVPTPFIPSLVSEWITDVSADLTNTAQKTAQPFRRSRAPTLLRLCARSACLLISPAHPEDL